MHWNGSGSIKENPLQILYDTALPQNFSGLLLRNGLYLMNIHSYVHLETSLIILNSHLSEH